jgi:hypothetical protein
MGARCCDAVDDLFVVIEANGDVLLLPDVVCFIIDFHAAPDVHVRQLSKSSGQLHSNSCSNRLLEYLRLSIGTQNDAIR